MKTRLMSLALASIFASLALTTSARAESCDNEAQATPENVFECNIDQNVQARLVAGWLENPEIQSTATFEKLLQNVGNFYAPQRAILDPVFARLLALSDEKLSAGKKLAVVDHADDLDGKASPAVMAYLKKNLIAGSHGCSVESMVAIRYRSAFPKNDPEMNRVISETMSSCSWDQPALFKEVAATIDDGYRSPVLPLMDEMNQYLADINAKSTTDCEGVGNGSTWKHDFQESVKWGLYYLGQSQVERAQSLVQNFMNVKCSVMRSAASTANGKIQTGINLKNAARGNAEALEWGMDFIQSHNGDFSGLEAQIITTFFQAAKVSPAAKAKIKRFARDEYDSGFHSGTPKLNAQLKQLANLK